MATDNVQNTERLITYTLSKEHGEQIHKVKKIVLFFFIFYFFYTYNSNKKDNLHNIVRRKYMTD